MDCRRVGCSLLQQIGDRALQVGPASSAAVHTREARRAHLVNRVQLADLRGGWRHSGAGCARILVLAHVNGSGALESGRRIWMSAERWTLKDEERLGRLRRAAKPSMSGARVSHGVESVSRHDRGQEPAGRGVGAREAMTTWPGDVRGSRWRHAYPAAGAHATGADALVQRSRTCKG